MPLDRQAYIAGLRQNLRKYMIELRFKRGDAYLFIGEYKCSLREFLCAQSLYEDAIGECTKAEIQWRLGRVHLFRGAFTEAQAYYVRSYEIYCQTGDREGQAECLKDLGKIQQYLEQNEAANDHYKQALALYESLGDQDGRHAVLECMVDYFRVTNRYEEALEILSGVITFYRDRNNMVKLNRNVHSKGRIYNEMGENDKSLHCFNQAMEIARNTGESIGMMNIYSDIGLLYMEKQEYGLAKINFEKCLDLSEKQGSTYMQAVTLLNLGDTCVRMKENEQAQVYLNAVLDMNLKIKGVREDAQRLLNLIVAEP